MGGWYRILARGNERRNSFWDERDREHGCDLGGKGVRLEENPRSSRTQNLESRDLTLTLALDPNARMTLTLALELSASL